MRALLIIGVAGCTPYMSAGYDATTKIHGPIAGLVNQPSASVRTDGPPAPAPVTDSYSFAIGGGIPAFGVELGVHLHEVNSQSFSVPSLTSFDPTSPRYLFGTTSLDFRVRWLKRGHLSANLHAGPAYGLLLDRTSGGHEVAQGVRVGTGMAVQFWTIAGFFDVYTSTMVFTDGPAAGHSTLAGLTLGVMLR